MPKPTKIFVCVVGLDQHEVGAITITSALRDAGMEVVYGGRFHRPDTIVSSALEEDVDVIGISCHSWEYLHYLDDLLALLDEKSLSVPVVLGGSVITKTDGDTLLAKGVAAVFGPSSTTEEVVGSIKGLAAAHGQA